MIVKNLNVARPHAYDRARKRFGVEEVHARGWYTQVLENSVLAYTQDDGRQVYQHKTKDIFTVYCPATNTVITTIDKPAHKVKITSPFLDPVVPVIERELKKMQAIYKRQVNELRREEAAYYARKSELTMNLTKVYNPKTLEAINRSLEELELDIAVNKRSRVLLGEEFERAEAKMNGFLRTTTGA